MIEGIQAGGIVSIDYKCYTILFWVYDIDIIYFIVVVRLMLKKKETVILNIT